MKTFFSTSSRVNRTISEQEIEKNALLSDLEKTKKPWRLLMRALIM